MEQISQLKQLGLFSARVPRYTSYPTAPHFNKDVSEQNVLNWIAAIPEGASISLYLHVPFCRRLCWFCACRTQGTQSEDPVRAYVRTLMQEIRLLARVLPRGVTLSRMHWGGGTPTLLPADTILQLAQAVYSILPLAQNAEFSVEIDPNEIDQPRINALAKMGMTRASIGVQDFDPEIQKTIGREQSFAQTQYAAKLIRECGITSLNADILFGLPHQTPERIHASVEKLLALKPDRVALYGYAHVPWMAKRQVMIPEAALPAPEARLALFDTARDLFLGRGYCEIGIDHFALPTDSLAKAQQAGSLRRNFQGYTDDQSQVLIGLGASSISHFPQGFAQNSPATGAHVAAIRGGHFSTQRGHIFSNEDRWRARMIEALMCDFQISATEIRQSFGLSETDLQALFAPVAERFGDAVQLDQSGLAITRNGRPLARLIAQMFDAYDMAPAAHSSAI